MVDKLSKAAPVAAAGLEILTGATLFVAPSLLARLLFGSEMGGSGDSVARISGLVMLCLAAGCLPAASASERGSPRTLAPLLALSVLDKPVPKGQIICSCPITDASSGGAQGYQILGPYPCDKSFFKYCKSDVANSKTGSTIYVVAPIGTAAALTALLTGKAAPPFNECGSE